jgi:multiple sugar transport system permease protein
MAVESMQSTTQVRPAGRVYLSRARRLTIVLTVITLLLAAAFLWPFMSIVANSFNRIDVRMNPLVPIPAAFTTELYNFMVTRYHFDIYLLNTVTVVATSTILSTLASALAGYALAKLDFPGRRIVFFVILAIMLLPTDTMLVPRFIVMRQLKLLNTFWGLILPSVGGGAFAIFLMRQFMLQIPTEMLEAGRIDGCSELGLFSRLVLPNMKAPIAVLAILSVSGGWNSVLWPQLLISDEAKQLLMPAIVRLNVGNISDPYAGPVVIAAALVSALVPLVLYLWSQRFFTNVMSGAIKG